MLRLKLTNWGEQDKGMIISNLYNLESLVTHSAIKQVGDYDVFVIYKNKVASTAELMTWTAVWLAMADKLGIKLEVVDEDGGNDD